MYSIFYEVPRWNIEKKPSPVPLRVKKLYVLAALLVEQHHEQRKVISYLTIGPSQ